MIVETEFGQKYKECDKCGDSSKGIRIFRACIQVHFPFYKYDGFDLCENCLNELYKVMANFFK